MLDNDLIRLQQKLDTVIELRELKDGENADNRKKRKRQMNNPKRTLAFPSV